MAFGLETLPEACISLIFLGNLFLIFIFSQSAFQTGSNLKSCQCITFPFAVLVRSDLYVVVRLAGSAHAILNACKQQASCL